MNPFHYQSGQLFCENVSLADTANKIGTPTYVYSQSVIQDQTASYGQAVAANTANTPCQALVCYAVKANGNPAILRRLGEAGLGADVTSGGELFLAQHAGIPPDKIIFSGVGKTRPEIETAIDSGIRALHVESEMELAVVASVASERCRLTAVGVRVNPNIRAETHPYISTGLKAHKFGVSRERALAMLQDAAVHPWLQPVGLATHIGSQIMALSPFEELAQFLVSLAGEIAGMGIRLAYLDVGGGLGIDYAGDRRLETGDPSNLQPPVSIPDWVTAVAQPIIRAGYDLVLEPGRSIIGPAGALLTRVVYVKQQGEKQFVITDAGMNDLLRPTLYSAEHPIYPLRQPEKSTSQAPVNFVGPICETSDFLAWERPFPPVQPGDLIAVMQAGAYGFAMSSNYNGRLRPAEALINGEHFCVIRQRQQLKHLLDGCIEDEVLEDSHK